MAALLLGTDPSKSDLHRRRLLEQSDRLLDRVEQLRLMEQGSVPPTLDRWSWAQGRAGGGARDRRGGAPRLVTRARVAWTNYWELRCEAEALLGEPLPAGGPGRRR